MRKKRYLYDSRPCPYCTAQPAQLVCPVCAGARTVMTPAAEVCWWRLQSWQLRRGSESAFRMLALYTRQAYPLPMMSIVQVPLEFIECALERVHIGYSVWEGERWTLVYHRTEIDSRTHLVFADGRVREGDSATTLCLRELSPYEMDSWREMVESCLGHGLTLITDVNDGEQNSGAAAPLQDAGAGAGDAAQKG